ncbi:MAG: aminotransferase class IV [Myxococcales bacterium]|nr:aminotransferase class IV [Myxococcales bacterium]
MKVWLNGALVERDRARVSLLSHAFGRASSVFEVVEVAEAAQGPCVFAGDAHLARLLRSAELMGMTPGYSLQELREAMCLTLRENGVRDGYAKVFCYYSCPELGIFPSRDEVDVAVLTIDMGGLRRANADGRGKPIAVGISRWRKLDQRTVPIQAKVAGHYVNGYLASLEARQRGFDDVLLLDTDGNVAESATSSVFFVRGGRLRTPPLPRVLDGITRAACIELAPEVGMEVAQEPIAEAELASMDEAFLASSVGRISPIARIDDMHFGDGQPGPFTRRLSERLDMLYAGRHPASRRWLTPIA